MAKIGWCFAQYCHHMVIITCEPMGNVKSLHVAVYAGIQIMFHNDYLIYGHRVFAVKKKHQFNW